MSEFKDNYEKALWAIANGSTDSQIGAKAEAAILRGIARESLGEKWEAYVASVEGAGHDD